MSFTDPMVITIGGTAYTFNRISNTDLRSVYQTADGTKNVTIGHQKTGKNKSRVRTLWKYTETRFTADPFVPTQNISIQDSIHVVIDRPVTGFNQTDVVNQFAGIVAALTASSNAAVVKLYGMES